MTKEQAAHAMSIAADVHDLILVKYAAGVEKHQSLLWDKTPLELLDEALNETIDQAVYLLTLREKMVASARLPPREPDVR